MSKKVFLVTGGNKGIGREVTRQLASKGHTVYFGARDVKRGEEALASLKSAGDVRFVELDLTNPATHAAAAKKIAAEAGSLDGLMNNAGISLEPQTPSQVSLENMRTTFETNVFGTIGVTQAMLPLLRAGKSKVIVNTSSALGSLNLGGDESWPYSAVNVLAYNSSKTALNMFTVSLAKELRAEGFKVNSISPGHVATDMGGANAPGKVEDGAAISVRLALSEDDGVTGLFFSAGGVVPW